MAGLRRFKSNRNSHAVKKGAKGAQMREISVIQKGKGTPLLMLGLLLYIGALGNQARCSHTELFHFSFIIATR